MNRTIESAGPVEGPVLIGDILRRMYPDLLAFRGNDALLNTDTSTCNEPNKEDTEV